MINREIFESLKEQFVNYAKQFSSKDVLVQQHFNVKINHAQRVCELVENIATRVDASERNVFLAKTAALFHDIGRFEQYKRYQTFSDFRSVDHAELGVSIINENNFLNQIDPWVKNKVCSIILNHNKDVVLPQADPDVNICSKILRDADKIDIFRVVREFDLQQQSLETAEDRNYKIPDHILNSFTRHCVVKISDTNYAKHDLTLFRISWIFDINFQSSFQLLDQAGNLTYFLQRIPKSYRLINIQNIVREYMVEKIFTYA